MIRPRKAAVFLDRDGVINYNRDDYVKSWAEFRFLPGALAALKRLAIGPFVIVIITNQSAVGRGILDTQGLAYIHAQMTQTILGSGGRIDRIFYCPHRPEDNCPCRKPKPGMLKQAADDLNIDLTRSYLVGDALSDLQAGLTVGCLSSLVLTGRGTAARDAMSHDIDKACEIFPDLYAAVDWILEKS